MGYDVAGFGALVHPLGSMAFIIPAAQPPPYRYTERALLTGWAQDLVRFARQILSPHATSWTYWSAGRRLRNGSPKFSGILGYTPGEAPAREAVVNDPPTRASRWMTHPNPKPST